MFELANVFLIGHLLSAMTWSHTSSHCVRAVSVLALRSATCRARYGGVCTPSSRSPRSWA